MAIKINMKVFVICNNDSIEFVVCEGKQAANKKCNSMKKEYLKKNPSNKDICYWHIHEVESDYAD